ncbi:19009_t:CDS:2 [Entrophospora sp. SA101]|nr:11898_t:CDS:2 [Entrophospora sp. SA101]CAJ0760406.1 19009_t:CDS:2 [Entrophospora sp. SA101]CAJ0824135.1 2344_t:CDS:2 [Entrophospora sp. SA101]CAJ0834539.1 12392_t:CDS:2 [Entrophospora sp. SA101]
MGVYENKDFNSDDDCATVRGDESEAEHTDFLIYNNNNIVNYGIKRMRSNSSLGETFNNYDDELPVSKSMDCTIENSNMDIINSIDNNDDYSINSGSNSSSDNGYNTNHSECNISITVNTKSETKRMPPSKKQLISKSNIGNDDGIKQKKNNDNNKDKVTKTRKLSRSPNNKKKQTNNKSLRFQSTDNISNSNKQRFIYKVNEIDKNDIFTRDRAGQTNLHRACQEGKLDRVKYLIDKGSDINACDNAGWSSLHEAAYHGYLDIVCFLLENGAEVNAISYDELDTPLHDACAEGHEDIIRVLLEYGADPEKTNVNEKRPVDYTSNKNIVKLLGTFVEVVKTPVKKSNLLYSDKRPSNALLLKSDGAIGSSNEDDVQTKKPTILEVNSDPKFKPKGVRSKFSNNDILRMDLKSRDLSGRSQLHIHAKKGNIEMVGNLIEAGAKINITDNHGRTPLHESAYEGRYEIVNILVAMGANINATDNKFNTPLHDAVKNGHTGVVEVLLFNNAKPGEKNIEDRVPLDLAKCRKDIVELLCKTLHLNPEDYLYPIINNNNDDDEITKKNIIEPHEEMLELEVKGVLIDNNQTSLDLELQVTPEYLKDKYSGPLYTVQLNTSTPGYPLATPIISPSGTLFVVDLQVELILNLKISTLIQLYPSLINRSISLMEKERLWPLLRSMIWAPSKSINPSEVVALEDQRKSKFLEVQMHFVKYEEAIKLIKDKLKNLYLTTVELDISDYPNIDDDKTRINYGSMEIDNDNKYLPITYPLSPISPIAPNRFEQLEKQCLFE